MTLQLECVRILELRHPKFVTIVKRTLRQCSNLIVLQWFCSDLYHFLLISLSEVITKPTGRNGTFQISLKAEVTTKKNKTDGGNNNICGSLLWHFFGNFCLMKYYPCLQYFVTKLYKVILYCRECWTICWRRKMCLSSTVWLGSCSRAVCWIWTLSRDVTRQKIKELWQLMEPESWLMHHSQQNSCDSCSYFVKATTQVLVATSKMMSWV